MYLSENSPITLLIIQAMKRSIPYLLLSLILSLSSCEDKGQEDLQEYLIAVPITMTVEEFRNSIDIISPIPTQESGKIYAYQQLIFVNDKYLGIHVINNSDPANPQKQAFIKIPGNVDIAVKNNYLYADSMSDLLVFDISDIDNISLVNRLENVLHDNIAWPLEADFVDYSGFGNGDDVLVGWELKTERLSQSEFESRFGIIDGSPAFENTSANDSSGQGGSLARFKIVDNYLYAVDSHFINIFEISDLSDPKDMEDVYAGFDIETIFNRGSYLFLGSMRGMYIYDISNPSIPEFVSEFQHGTACDPVVVDENYAYVTLRGGNNCGALESGLFIVDISDINNPELAKNYPMDEPYGLGIKGDQLFVCDGASGLKVYDKSNIEELVALDHFKDVVTFDVIPLETTLLMVGDEVLYQYVYSEDGLDLLSRLDLN